MSAANITNLPTAVATPMMQMEPLPRGSALADPNRFKMNLQAAEVFSASDLVPNHYRNKAANCFIAICAAQRLGVDEFHFLQKSFVVGGKLGMSAELFIELCNSSGRFRGPMRFALHGEGDQRACTASAVLMDGTTVERTVTYAMAKADGWTRNPKWQSLTDQMLCYRAGTFLGRLYAGGAALGIRTSDELEDIAAATGRDVKQIERPAEPPPPPKPVAMFDIYIPGDDDPIRFPKTKRGIEAALAEIGKTINDGGSGIIGLNRERLDWMAKAGFAEEIEALTRQAIDAEVDAQEEAEAEEEAEADTFVDDDDDET